MLRKSLLSLRLQADEPDEIVVADDGSKPDVLEVLQEMAGDFLQRLVFVTQQDLGFRLARARNNGARAATGDYLYYTDQDIIAAPDALTRLRTSIRAGEFATVYALRFDEAQSARVTDETIRSRSFLDAASDAQREAARAQHRKDALYRLLYTVKLRTRGPKLRGCGFGVWATDFRAVNGFDERYVGWGREDDDFCRRLYALGIKGRNVSESAYGVHLHHPTNSPGPDNPNRDYYRRRIPEIRRGGFRCEFGIDSPLGEDRPATVVLRP